MIPLSIELKNFRSFVDSGEIPLNFAPLFCIVGRNGAGKSSIIEAILWALFGKSRENIRGATPMRTGEKWTRVKFDFAIESQRYRIIRSNGNEGHKLSFLKLDSKTNKFVSVIYSHRISDIQRMIEDIIGADYKGLRLATVFVQNESAIFSTISPSERQKVLVKLLGIELYEILRKKAGRKARDNDAVIESLHSQLNIIENKLNVISDPTDELKKIEIKIDKMKSNLSELNTKLSDAIRTKNLIDSFFSKKGIIEKSLQSKRGEAEQISNLIDDLKKQKNEIEEIVVDEKLILQLKKEFDKFTSRAKHLSTISARRAKILENIDTIKQKITSEKSKHNEKINRLEGEISQISQEIEHSQEKIKDADFLRKKLDELQVERQVFEELTTKKQQFEELSQTILYAQTEIKAEKRNIREQIEQMDIRRKKLENELLQLPLLKKRLKDTDTRIKMCRQNREEIDRIREKIKSLNFRIENRNQNMNNIKDDITNRKKQLQFIENEKISRCPLCGSELTDEHKSELIKKLFSEIENSKKEIRQIEDEVKELQLTIRELEIKSDNLAKDSDSEKLRKEYEETSIQIANLESSRKRLDEINEEIDKLREKLQSGNFAGKWRSIMSKTEDKLKSLNFDIEAYNKVRRMVEQLSNYEKKWEVVSEYIQKIKTLSYKLEDSKNKLAQIKKIPVSIIELEKKMKIETEKLKSLEYDEDELQKIHTRLDELQNIPQQFFRLQQAKTELPRISDSIIKLKNRYETIMKEISQMDLEIKEIDKKFEQKEILEKLINELQRQKENLSHSISELDEYRIELKAELKSFDDLCEQSKILHEQIRKLQNEAELYRIVEKILGPMGIQNWLLNGYLKNLEEDANDTLALLSENVLKVRLVPEGDEKLMIHISDRLGERVYESYSGGEEFRIDFSLRLALSRLLAKRAGFPLQTLIVDEGFGSQDEIGLSNLIDALYQVQSQFARIIVVTHLDILKNAFPSRLEVKKDELGSKVRVVA